MDEACNPAGDKTDWLPWTAIIGNVLGRNGSQYRSLPTRYPEWLRFSAE
jgi:hypothetical protein